MDYGAICHNAGHCATLLPNHRNDTSGIAPPRSHLRLNGLGVPVEYLPTEHNHARLSAVAPYVALLIAGLDLRHDLWLPDALWRDLSELLQPFRSDGSRVDGRRSHPSGLPRHLLRFPDVPRYLFGYTLVLGLNSCLYLFLTVKFTVGEFELWLFIFTLANLYLCLRELETMAIGLPKPVIAEVEESPAVEQIEKTDHEDFNEANRQRFERVEYWMQHNRDTWKDFTFNRDNLCEATGINRHLVLQALRSQGYNNIHEYINAYRIDELRRMVKYGLVRTPKDCLDAGFGSIKTARASFLRVTGESLDDFLQRKT